MPVRKSCRKDVWCQLPACLVPVDWRGPDEILMRLPPVLFSDAA